MRLLHWHPWRPNRWSLVTGCTQLKLSARGENTCCGSKMAWLISSPRCLISLAVGDLSSSSLVVKFADVQMIFAYHICKNTHTINSWGLDQLATELWLDNTMIYNVSSLGLLCYNTAWIEPGCHADRLFVIRKSTIWAMQKSRGHRCYIS